MKKRLAQVCLIALCLALALMHTQPVERFIFRKVQKELAALGWQLQAKRFDLNLFRLSVDLRNLELSGSGVQASLDDLHANGSLGLLLGNLSLDRITASQGNIKIVPQPAAASPKKTGPITIPKIYLGEAQFDQVALELQDQKRTLDFKVQDINLNYQDQKVTLGLATPASEIQGRAIPALTGNLSFDSETFQTFDNLQLAITSKQSNISIKGNVSDGFVPDLQWNAHIGQDLLPEHPGTTVSGGIDPTYFTIQAENQLAIGSLNKSWRLNGQINYRDPEVESPIDFQITDLLTGQLRLWRRNGDLLGVISAQAQPQGVQEIVPQLAITQGIFEGELTLPKMDVAQLRSKGTLRLKGQPQATLDMVYENQTLGLTGQVNPAVGAQVNVNGTLKDGLALRFNGQAVNLQTIDSYVTLPSQISSGPIRLEGAVSSENLRDFSLAETQVWVNQASYESYFQDDVQLTVSGPLAALQGSISSQSLNPNQAAITFELDAMQQQWQSLGLNFQTLPLPLDSFNYQVSLQAEGQGALLKPGLSGNMRAEFTKKDRPVGFFASKFQNQNDLLIFSDLTATSHHGDLRGGFRYDLSQNQWQTDLKITGQKHDGWEPLLDITTPEFVFQIVGDQDNLSGQMRVPQQSINVANFAIPIETNDALEIEGNPNNRTVQGDFSAVTIAGVSISDTQFGLESGQFKLQSDFSLANADVLKTLLADSWPEDVALETLQGQVLVSSDQAFENPVVQLKLMEMNAQFRQEPLVIQELHAQWQPSGLTIQPTTFQFAGSDISFSTNEPSTDEPRYPLDLNLGVALNDSQKLVALAGKQWPADLELSEFQGQVRLRGSWDLQNPLVDVNLEKAEAYFNDQLIQANQLTGGYNGGIWLTPGDIQIGDLTLQLRQKDNGLAVQAQPDMAFLAQWVPGLVGDATFDLNLYLSETGTDFQARVKQTGGRLIYPEPWVEVEAIDIQIEETSPGVYELKPGKALANGKNAGYSGLVDLTGEEPNVTLTTDLEDLRLAFADYQFSLNAVLQWQMNESHSEIIGTVAVKDGYFSPDIEVEGLVQELLSPVPAIFFPDPMLESVKLQVNVLTENPMVVEHDLGYWELETPALIIGGNLASPLPISGSLNINDGSVLRQGRNTFLFQNSQVQFHRNRINDPYLQIAMVDAADGEEKQPIYFTGYISEIDKNLGNQDITSFLLKFLLGRVTSLVSFEIQISDSLTESSFITWVSRRLTDKVVVRYAIPLNDQEPLLEVKMGPFRRNFLNLSEEENTYRSAIRHAQRFGFLSKPAETVKKVIFEAGDLPKEIRKRFKLEKGDTYSETRRNYALFDLRRRMKRLGFLAPKIDASYEDRIFRVAVDPGPKFQMNVEGIEVSPEEKQQLLLEMLDQSESSNRHLELLVEKLALSKGHPSAAAFAQVEGTTISIEVYVGFAIETIQLDFGKAQPLIGDLYASPEESRRFMIKYFISQSDGESELRARLAAKGYVVPEIEPAIFPTQTTATIPIEPGPRATLFSVVVNGEQQQSEFLHEPFQYDFIAQTVQEFGKTENGQRYAVRLTPHRLDEDIIFDVIKTELVDQNIEQLKVEGEGRLSEEKIRSFLGFKEDMPQSKLMKNQLRLVETGSFTLARLRNSGNVALLEVRERNRWDVDYELSYDEVNEIGLGVQFRDRMMFKGFNPLGIGVRRNRLEEEFIARQQFLRVLGTPIDLFVGLGWNNERLDLEPDQSDPMFGIVFVTQRPRETTNINAGLSYRLFENQLLTAGITWERIVTRQFEDVFFFDENNQLVPDPTIPSARLVDLKVNRVPIRTSWLYSNLDNELYPNRGIFSQLSYEYFPRGLGTNRFLSGWRALAKFNTFYTFGRWRWWQRLEAGLYQRQQANTPALENEADTGLFFLGGPKSIRGFGYELVGPLQRNAGGRLAGIGGQAMAIWTQELNFDLNFYGLGLSPFLDGGWVWQDRKEFLKGGMVITGGLGLTLETPIGRFRFDWGKPLDDGPFDRMLQDMFDNDREGLERARDQVLDQFSIRFGRVF